MSAMMYKSVLWCVLVPWSLWTEASLSGFYVENSLEQTVVEHVLTRQEKREVEHEILNLLGLPNRPRAVSPATLASSAPKFLLDVYKSLLEPTAGRAPRSEFNLSGQDLHAIDESDVIMSFASHICILHCRWSPSVATLIRINVIHYCYLVAASWSRRPGLKRGRSLRHHSTAVRHERGKRLWFDVSEVPSGENIVGAELRLYQIAQILSPLVTFTVTVYQLISVDQGSLRCNCLCER
uniref:TGF-beta propeptide domain-containing protein n=1 Tax=Timema shepardi TaxID=629360 RepID=A0A7R9FZX3_TIMSH|nr:unnamed protein product [Timema shepardi]